ncbi:S66 peptidase family protein [Nonlabens ponticola]|uniref:LD-carboxypeptidase n=1 Tax=Nonlabens ponticola TaxID=2496866 RepID=A0A3S9MV33_9FLAO|nr:LD-carboxypeptidase [Nonlabens ponticola]AZQ43031.1 LD-carboxypeptidase [Nonlabens ponticola]
MNYLPHKSPQPGSHIRILCTARGTSIEKLAPAIQWLEESGYRVSLGETVGKKHHQFGGTRQERLDDMNNALKDPDVDAIWVARGGYGSIQIVDDLNPELVKTSNTLLLGYSDVTVLHALWQQAGLQSIHTFMPQEWNEKPPQVLNSFLNTIKGKEQTYKLPNADQHAPAIIKAPVIGGNLSVLCSMIGSSTYPSHEDHILFMEDLDELLYHIDRLMTMLERAGKLKNLKVLLVGGMTDMRDHEIPFGKNARQIIEEHTAGVDFPVIFDFPAGHIVDNYSFTLGKMMQIEIGTDLITITQ